MKKFEIVTLVNYKTRCRKYITWDPLLHNTYYYSNRLEYIGMTNDLGGLSKMENEGWIVRKTIKPYYFNRNKLRLHISDLITEINRLVDFFNKEENINNKKAIFFEIAKIRYKIRNIKI